MHALGTNKTEDLSFPSSALQALWTSVGSVAVTSYAWERAQVDQTAALRSRTVYTGDFACSMLPDEGASCVYRGLACLRGAPWSDSLGRPRITRTSHAGVLRHGTYEDRQAVVFRRLGTLFRLHEAIPPAGHILDERGIDVARRHLSSSTLWIEQRARRSQKRMELLL